MIEVRRGSALLVTLIALAVLMVIVVATIQFTGDNRTAASAKIAGDETAACAEVARRYLLSQLRTYGVSISSLTFDERLADDATLADRSRIMSAHYSAVAAAPTIVTVSSDTVGGAAKQLRDMSNAAPSSTTIGGQYYRVVVLCRQSGGRESELEFVFRHGL